MTAQEIRDRSRRIRSATPKNVLEELFEMQNRRCDLCGEHIQDLILAALDHSVPVILFARGVLPIEEAIAQANDPANLRAAHASCNSAKNGRTREEWFALGLDKKVGRPRVWTDAELLEYQFRLGAGGRVASPAKKAGLAALHADPEFARARDERMKKLRADPEIAKASVERMKRLHADPAFAKAHVERIKKLYADPEFAKAHAERSRERMKRLHADPEYAKWHVERMKRLNADPKIKNASVERMKRLHADPAFAKVISERGRETMKRLHADPEYAKANAERGRERMKKLNADPEFARAGSEQGNHQRWHVQRSIVNAKCPLCPAQECAA